MPVAIRQGCSGIGKERIVKQVAAAVVIQSAAITIDFEDPIQRADGGVVDVVRHLHPETETQTQRLIVITKRLNCRIRGDVQVRTCRREIPGVARQTRCASDNQRQRRANHRSRRLSCGVGDRTRAGHRRLVHVIYQRRRINPYRRHRQRHQTGHRRAARVDDNHVVSAGVLWLVVNFQR